MFIGKIMSFVEKLGDFTGGLLLLILWISIIRLIWYLGTYYKILIEKKEGKYERWHERKENWK